MSKNEQILVLSRIGWKQKEMAKELGISQQTVSYSLKKFRETASTEKRRITGRKKTVTTPRTSNLSSKQLLEIRKDLIDF